MRERPGGRPQRGKGAQAGERGRARSVAQQRLGNVDLGARVSGVLVSTPLRMAPKSLQPFLPSAAAPDPSALVDVALPDPPPPPSDEEVKQRALVMLGRALGRERRFKDLVEPDDRVRVSCLAFAGGAPVPFTARHHVELLPGDERIPGAHQGVIGKAVGTSVVVPIALPDAPGQPRAGQRANLVVEIVTAFADERASLDDDVAVRRSELAPSAAALLERARTDLSKEAEVRWRGARRDAVLRQARASHPVDVPEASIDALVHVTWALAEGPLVERMKLPADEQRALLEAWLADEDIRQDARVRLWTMALVQAFGKSRGVELHSVAAGKRLLEEAPGAIGLSANAIGSAFDDVARDGAREGVWYLEAAERLVTEVVAAKR